MNTKQNSRFLSLCIFFIASIILALAVSRILHSQANAAMAYAGMYTTLKSKSELHLNLVSYYEGCLESRAGNASTGGIARSLRAEICLNKTLNWTQKLKMKGPVKTILEDIRLAEAATQIATAKFLAYP